ncbi:hypothetical protein [Halogeometricum borinquense]|nr:hypothetical protein [Halogeometricum borinquense]
MITYLGEGLTGDQSENSPGNVNLLRALTELISILSERIQSFWE